VEGLGDQMKGKIKEIKGKATGDRKVEVEGKLQQGVGTAKEKTARARRKVEHKIDEARSGARRSA